jgi:uncharacterized protein (DUF362 family)/Pyruvate/2-oxoacid:ferredoxin oxidoreductase delta subunit
VEENRPRVSIRRCAEYRQDVVENALSFCLSDLGGMGRYVKKGERIVLKVNLLRAARPEEAITTHPSVVLALSREVEKAGGAPLVADSPGGQFTAGRLRRVYGRSGLLALEMRGELKLNWDISAARVSFPEGKVLKSVDILKVVKEADGVITVPKLKTHTQTIITGATKILYGVIPGLAKAGYHAKLPDKDDFNEMLLDLLCLVNPRLSVMDGILGMEGNGPSVGTLRRGNVLLAGPSGALDVVSAAIMGLHAGNVPLLRAAAARQLAPIDIDGLEILGDSLEAVRTGGWKIPASRVGVLEHLAEGLPPKLMRRMGTLLIRRPAPDRARCTACGECVRGCPQKCIRIVNDRLNINYSRCISCFCCSEMCPSKAMRVKEPLFSRKGASETK